MRRSFGPMGGGSVGGGGGMLKTVHRAMRAGSGTRGASHEPFSHSTTTSHNNTTNSPTYRPSSSDNKNNLNTISFSSNHHDHPYPSSSINQYDDFVFCTVPSMDEVHHAISSLQQVLYPPTSFHDSEWDLDWIEPSTSMLKAHCGSECVYDAFHLLQTEPSVKKMVMSLSSDKSVWEAVMNNEAVRELRDSVYEANKTSILGDVVDSPDGPTPVPDVLQWILVNTKAKLMDLVKKTTEMVNKLFRSTINEKANDQEGAKTEPFETIVRSSFFLSVMVLLIVVVTRTCRL
ncbi:hypothetical protein M8C21_003682 [Ambrosia artemisiifolia]|uniref:Transmembrane protein n=1 Tax=Ambrosia artemisiifolia TaxID=4212 RepID=A0AAD5GHU9_AMBAR|nr:hypothetical protein M8C21_003682 [Ambrosia artemisiifolia]